MHKSTGVRNFKGPGGQSTYIVNKPAEGIHLQKTLAAVATSKGGEATTPPSSHPSQSQSRPQVAKVLFLLQQPCSTSLPIATRQDSKNGTLTTSLGAGARDSS